MTKQLFIETIRAIKKQVDHDSKCIKAFSVILSDDYITGYNNKYLFSIVIHLLESAMKDKSKWIEYFIYELNFGRDYKPGRITQGEENIDLSSASKLYDFLIENKKEKE